MKHVPRSPAFAGSLQIGLVIAVAVVIGATSTAAAYPQFQLSRDQMCTSCHLSPDGGGLLSENGLVTADAMAQFKREAPEFLNGAFEPPSWLQLGADFRSMLGYTRTPQQYLAWFPMQADLYAAVTRGNFSGNATVGYRPSQEGNELATTIWAREHYVMWQSERSAAEGIWIRAGHFMPTFGLRLAEHPVYTRRFGGTQLYSETYGASVSYITARYEAHASGFVENPLMDALRLDNGGALYGELRLSEQTQVGGGAMLEINDWQHKYRGTVTAKHYLATPGVLVQGELQIVNPHVGDYGYNQIVGHVMGSYFVTDSILVDAGFGYYDENIRISQLERESFDLNVHWFATSHFEAMLVTRYEQLGILGAGGPFGGYAFLQAHYRL